MASKNKYYTVLMRLFGERERHSYILGVFDSKHKAIESGKKEWQERGEGKYEPIIQEWDINVIDNHLFTIKYLINYSGREVDNGREKR